MQNPNKVQEADNTTKSNLRLSRQGLYNKDEDVQEIQLDMEILLYQQKIELKNVTKQLKDAQTNINELYIKVQELERENIELKAENTAHKSAIGNMSKVMTQTDPEESTKVEHIKKTLEAYQEQYIIMQHRYLESEKRNHYLQEQNTKYFEELTQTESRFCQMFKKYSKKRNKMINQYCNLKYQIRLEKVKYKAYVDAQQLQQRMKRQKQKIKEEQEDLLKYLPGAEAENTRKSFFQYAKQQLLEKLDKNTRRKLTEDDQTKSANNKSNKQQELQIKEQQFAIDQLKKQNDELVEQLDLVKQEQSKVVQKHESLKSLNIKLEEQVFASEQRYEQLEALTQQQNVQLQAELARLHRENLQLRCFIEERVRPYALPK